jgi:hypothetical protein
MFLRRSQNGLNVVLKYQPCRHAKNDEQKTTDSAKASLNKFINPPRESLSFLIIRQPTHRASFVPPRGDQTPGGSNTSVVTIVTLPRTFSPPAAGGNVRAGDAVSSSRQKTS